MSRSSISMIFHYNIGMKTIEIIRLEKRKRVTKTIRERVTWFCLDYFALKTWRLKMVKRKLPIVLETL